jgi:hypothetical protein
MTLLRAVKLLRGVATAFTSCGSTGLFVPIWSSASMHPRECQTKRHGQPLRIRELMLLAYRIARSSFRSFAQVPRS